MTGDRVEHDATRESDDDHDLLTYNETGARLHDAVLRTKTDLAQSTSAAERERLEAHLEALLDALERNTRRARTHPGETGFLTYKPRRDR
jgi:hypothetical protein